jgi:hypothetical protein
MAQIGFFEPADRYTSLDATKGPRVEIDAVVPWEACRPTLGRVWHNPAAERHVQADRRPAEVQSLVLSALYNLSDEQTEYQALDRLSFMRSWGSVWGIVSPMPRPSACLAMHTRSRIRWRSCSASSITIWHDKVILHGVGRSCLQEHALSGTSRARLWRTGK